MIKKKKKAKVETKKTVKTTTRLTKKTTTLSASRRARIQKNIRQTAVPNLRKLTADQESSTTGVWDKLTGLPFYSTTQVWATPTKKKSSFALIKAVSGEEEYDDDAEDEEYSSEDDSLIIERGDETVESATTVKPKKAPKAFTLMSSPGPDASESEIRRFWWKMKQKKRGNDKPDDSRGKLGRYLRKLKLNHKRWR